MNYQLEYNKLSIRVRQFSFRYQFRDLPETVDRKSDRNDGFSTTCQIKAAETHSFWINSFNVNNKPMTWEREAKRQSLPKTQRPSS